MIRNTASTATAINSVRLWTSDDDESGWLLEPSLIEFVSSGDDRKPKIAISSYGHIVVVWENHHEPLYDRANQMHIPIDFNSVWANDNDGRGYGDSHDATWGPVHAKSLEEDRLPDVEQLNSDGRNEVTGLEGSASDPQIAINDKDNDSGRGSYIVVWKRYDGTHWSIMGFHCDSSFVEFCRNDAELIEHDDAGDASDPQIAADNHGNAIAVWQQHDGRHWNMWSNRYISGKGWGMPQLIAKNNRGDAQKQQIAMNSHGNAIAVWQQSDGKRLHIMSNFFTAP